MTIPFFRTGSAVLALSFLICQPAFASVADIQSMIDKGQYAEALKQADQDLTASPRDPQTRFLKGIALTEMNRSDDAIEVFSKLTHDYPELPEPYNNLAVLYAQKSEFDKAKSALEMAIRTHPSYATAHENLGDVYARLARQAYNKALQIDAANTSAKSKLALIRQLMTVSGVPGETVSGVPGETVAAAAPATPAPPTPVADTAPASEAPVATPAPEAPPAPAPAKEAPASPPPAVAAPQPAAPEPAPVATNDSAAIETAVLAWAQAWSAKDVTAYLSHYATDFDPPGANPVSAGRPSASTWSAKNPGKST
ncbi:tetratricopeptide repeat protein [Nitrogeniibacter mangrovi]|uniref:tetratricopeptide repeat protein n=1 Tax=Nitrogeniibacter mangrovi TaxID=2016596 RepID=UPI001C2D1F08|nr:tetratricopeptide repeat protein [Nitrogeniibacter mangrovi]